MANTTCFYGDVNVKRTDKSYKVTFECGEVTIYVKSNFVEQISKVYWGDENLVAILWATIELTRRLNAGVVDKKNEQWKISNTRLVEVLIKLLVSEYYSLETYIALFQEMTYHDIVNIFLADNPVRALSEL